MTFLPNYYESIYGKMNNPTNLTSLGDNTPSTQPSLLQILAYIAFGGLVVSGFSYCTKRYGKRSKRSRRH